VLDAATDRQALKESFERDGYLIFDPKLASRTLDGAVADVELGPRRRWPPFTRATPAHDAGRVTDGWTMSQSIKKIALAPATLDLLRTLYGREPRPFQTLNFRVGTQQRPHADSVHFNSEPRGFMCGVWVALEDVDMDCGPLVYYPGSQKLPPVTPSDVGIEIEPGQEAVPHEEYEARYEPYIEQLMEREGLEPKYATVRKGQALVWAADLVHGGSPVRVPGRTRRSQVTHYFFEGTRLWTPLLSSEEHVAWREAPQIQ
jgi:hypothetical protein